MTSYDPGDMLSGSLTVAANRRSVSAVQIVVGPQAVTDCGSGTITVAGSAPMHVVRGGPKHRPEYLVGHNDPVVAEEAYEPKPLTVSISLDGQTFNGQLLVAFRLLGASSIGILAFTNPAYPASYGPCEYQFTLAPS
jgi:hypothetical protein